MLSRALNYMETTSERDMNLEPIYYKNFTINFVISLVRST